MATLKRIAVIGCGGTISSLASHSLDVMDYPEYGSKLDVKEVLARVPETTQIAETVPVAFRAAGSSSFGPSEWAELRTLVETMAQSVEGVVILHGTATLEETAYFLHLTLRVPIPAVVVGSQRPINVVSSDAGLNLVSALRVASDARMSKLGVVVVANDDIHCARDVMRTSNIQMQKFEADSQTIDEEFDRSHTEFMPVLAGQCSLHDTFLIHSSPPNNSDHRRVGLGISYIPDSSKCLSKTRLTAMLMRGKDDHDRFDDEPRPHSDYGEAEQSFHREAVARFQQSIAEQAAKY